LLRYRFVQRIWRCLVVASVNDVLRVELCGTEDVWEIFDTQAQLFELREEGWVPHQSNSISVGRMWSQLVDVSNIVTSSEVYVLALRVVDELPEERGSWYRRSPSAHPHQQSRRGRSCA